MAQTEESQMLSQTQRLQALEQALKDGAPQAYLRLKMGGGIEAFLEQRENEMMKSYYQKYGEAYYQVLLKTEDRTKTLRALKTVQSKIFDDVLATWTSFGPLGD